YPAPDEARCRKPLVGGDSPRSVNLVFSHKLSSVCRAAHLRFSRTNIEQSGCHKRLCDETLSPPNACAFPDRLSPLSAVGQSLSHSLLDQRRPSHQHDFSLPPGASPVRRYLYFRL